MQPLHYTITPDTYQQLVRLRDDLSAFQTVTCRMMHEQVQELSDETVTGDNNLDELRVIRKGLCKVAARRNFLGCAHTSANIAFARLADNAYDLGILQTSTLPSETINDLALKIYLIDHEKGAMEKQKAFAQHQQQSARLITIQDTLQDITSRYQTVIDQLELFRQDIMNQINTAIVTVSPASPGESSQNK